MVSRPDGDSETYAYRISADISELLDKLKIAKAAIQQLPVEVRAQGVQGMYRDMANEIAQAALRLKDTGITMTTLFAQIRKAQMESVKMLDPEDAQQWSTWLTRIKQQLSQAYTEAVGTQEAYNQSLARQYAEQTKIETALERRKKQLDQMTAAYVRVGEARAMAEKGASAASIESQHGDMVRVGSLYTRIPKGYDLDTLTRMEDALQRNVSVLERFIVGADVAAAAVAKMKSPMEAIDTKNVAIIEEALSEVRRQADATREAIANTSAQTPEGRRQVQRFKEELQTLTQNARDLQSALNKASIEAAQFAANSGDLYVRPSLLGKTSSDAYGAEALKQVAGIQGVDIASVPTLNKLSEKTRIDAQEFGRRVEKALADMFTAMGASVDGISKRVSGRIAGVNVAGEIDRVIDPAVAGIQNAEAEVIIDVKAVNDEVFKYIREYGDFVKSGGDAVVKLREMLASADRYAAQAAEYILQLNAYAQLAGKSAYMVGTPNFRDMQQQYADLVRQGMGESEALRTVSELAARRRQNYPVAVKPGTGEGPAPLSAEQMHPFLIESLNQLREQASTTRVLSEIDTARLATAERLAEAHRAKVTAAQEESKRLEEIAALEQQRANTASGSGGGGRNLPPVTTSSAAPLPEPPAGSSIAQQIKYYDQLLQQRQMDLYIGKQISDTAKNRVAELKAENAEFAKDREANEGRILANSKMIAQYQEIIDAQKQSTQIAKQDISLAEAKLKQLNLARDAQNRGVPAGSGSVNPADAQSALFGQLKTLPDLTLASYAELKQRLGEIIQEMTSLTALQKGTVSDATQRYEKQAEAVARLASELAVAEAEAKRLTIYSSSDPRNFVAQAGAGDARARAADLQGQLSDAQNQLAIDEAIVAVEAERLAQLNQMTKGVGLLEDQYEDQYKTLVAGEKQAEKAAKERLALTRQSAKEQADADRLAKKTGAAAVAAAQLEAYRSGIDLRKKNIEQLTAEAAAIGTNERARAELKNRLEQEQLALQALQNSYTQSLKDSDLAAKALRAEAAAAAELAKQREKEASVAFATGDDATFTQAERVAQAARERATGLALAATAAEKDAAALRGLSTALRETQAAMGTLSKGIGNVEKQGKNWMSTIFSLKRVVSTFFGTFLSGLAFQSMAALQNAFQSSTEFAKELEVSLVNLDVSVRASQREFGDAAGSIEGWRQFIADLRSEFRAFNDSELSQGVSQIINYTRELNLSAEAQKELARSAAILALATPGKSFADAAEAVARGVAGEQRALRDYMVLISPELRDAKSLELYGKTYDTLANKVKQATVNMSVFYDLLSGRAEDAGAMLDNLAIREQASTNRIKSATVSLGDSWNFVWVTMLERTALVLEQLGRVAGVFGRIGGAINTAQAPLLKFLFQSKEVLAIFAAISSVTGLDVGMEALKRLFGMAHNAMQNVEKSIGDVARGISAELVPAYNEAMQKFKDLEAEAQKKRLEIEKKYNRDLIEARIEFLGDMAKLILGRGGEEAALAKERAEAFTDLTIKQTEENVQAYNQFQLKETREAEDFGIKMRRMQEDFDRAEQDAEKDHQRKLRDIRRSAYFDLLDAIREQDARAVLLALRKRNEALRNAQQENEDNKQKRLEDFEAKKKQAREDYNLERKRAKEDFELDAAERERKHNLERADLEDQYAEKERLLQASLDREQDQREASYSATQSKLKAQMRDDLDELQEWYRDEVDAWTQSWVDKYDITVEQLGLIMDEIESKLGPDGDLVAMYEAALEAIKQLNGSGGSVPKNQTKDPKRTSTGLIPAATGGTWMVNQPTGFLAGEGGQPEVVQVTPLSMLGGAGSRGAQQMQLNVNVTADEHFSIAFEDRVVAAIADVVESLK